MKPDGESSFKCNTTFRNRGCKLSIKLTWKLKSQCDICTTKPGGFHRHPIAHAVQLIAQAVQLAATISSASKSDLLIFLIRETKHKR